MAHDLKILSAAEYEKKYDETAKADIAKLSKILRGYISKPYMFNRVLASICEKMYAEGIAAVTGGEVVETGRCINVDYAEKYFMQCPYCGESFDIDLKPLLGDEGEGYAVNV